jgi:hypothetical protein
MILLLGRKILAVRPKPMRTAFSIPCTFGSQEEVEGKSLAQMLRQGSRCTGLEVIPLMWLGEWLGCIAPLTIVV